MRPQLCARGNCKPFTCQVSNLVQWKMLVLNLKSALDFLLDEKMMDSRNNEAFYMPLKLGPLAICLCTMLKLSSCHVLEN